MTVLATKQRLAKPFLKWAGGKGQLLYEIDCRLPPELMNGDVDTYVEPFVGGGAVFFHIAQRYKSIRHFYLFDINEDLVNCYNAIQSDVASVIADLGRLEDRYLRRDKVKRETMYYRIRDEFNCDRSPAKLIFLNKTCYNGLYRVNRNNEFNVPFGHYKNPTICDVGNLRAASEVLRKVQILCGDFEDSYRYIDNKTFVYFDPPYRPISPTASFTSYSKDNFTERDQIRLAEFCERVHRKGAKFLLSNSDPKNEDPTDRFFEDYYEGFSIDTVRAVRPINCKASGRGEINELLITI